MSFRRVATRTGGEVNNNTVYCLNAIVDSLSQQTLAARLSTHRLTLNSTDEGSELLAMIEAVARAESRLLEKLLEVRDGRGTHVLEGRIVDVEALPVTRVQPRLAAPPQRLLGGRTR